MLTDVNSLESRVLLRGFEGLDFAWAPDGGAIAYSALVPSKPAEFVAEIFVVGLAGGPPRSITPGFEGPYMVAGSPVWSPDGSKIAFDVGSACVEDPATGEFSCPQDIFVVGSDGGGLRNVTNSQIEEYYPDW
jgi:Tol biopolymer transport system component